MGSWFSNLNIRKGGRITVETVSEQLVQWMQDQQFEPTASAEDADGVMVLLTAEDSEWITVCTDLVQLEEPEQFETLGTAVSEALGSDVLGIACFDSDYLWLNLLNSQEKIDGWIGIGSGKELGFTRRNKLSPWKKKVNDYTGLALYVKENYILADAFLADAAQCLGLPVWMSSASVRYLEDIDPEKKAAYLYFRQREGAQNRNLVQMAHYEESRPALTGWERDITTVNTGAESKGLTIWFLAPGVAEDSVSFSDVCIVRQHVAMPIVLTKAQMPDGRWAWRWHDPEFPIPAAVTGRMKQEKRRELERQRSMTVRFTPRGDSRKTLDIQIGFVPDGNQDGGTWWSVWHKFGSKEDFIKWHNKTWRWVRSMAEEGEDVDKTCLPLLNRTDFD